MARAVRADPKTLTALPSSASIPKPSTNSDWMRSTRHGSVWTQSLGPRESSSRSSVVVAAPGPRRRVTGPRWRSLTSRARSGTAGRSLQLVTPGIELVHGSHASGRALRPEPYAGLRR